MTKEELIDKNKFIVHLPSGEELWFIKPEKCAEIMQQYAENYQMEKSLESLNQTGQTYMLPRLECKKAKEIALEAATKIWVVEDTVDEDGFMEFTERIYKWLIAE